MVEPRSASGTALEDDGHHSHSVYIHDLRSAIVAPVDLISHEIDERLQRRNCGPSSLVERCCPFILHMLTSLGYEDSLVIRSSVHLALWVSMVICLGFAVIWFSEVITFKCIPSSWANAEMFDYVACPYQFIGCVVYARAVVDCMGMIAHYDDDRQQALKEKWRTLELLNVESTTALSAAKKNVEALRSQVVGALRAQVVSAGYEFFAIIFANSAGPQSSAWVQGRDRCSERLVLAYPGRHRCSHGGELDRAQPCAATSVQENHV